MGSPIARQMGLGEVRKLAGYRRGRSLLPRFLLQFLHQLPLVMCYQNCKVKQTISSPNCLWSECFYHHDRKAKQNRDLKYHLEYFCRGVVRIESKCVKPFTWAQSILKICSFGDWEDGSVGEAPTAQVWGSNILSGLCRHSITQTHKSKENKKKPLQYFLTPRVPYSLMYYLYFPLLPETGEQCSI